VFVIGSGSGASHPVLQGILQSIAVRLAPMRYKASGVGRAPVGLWRENATCGGD